YVMYLLITHALTAIFTLFPYTTLFRSSLPRLRGRSRLRRRSGLSRRRVGRRRLHAAPRHGRDVPIHEGSGARWVRRHLRRPEALDRKSTRLNSSHVKISYAVFCLKKTK